MTGRRSIWGSGRAIGLGVVCWSASRTMITNALIIIFFLPGTEGFDTSQMLGYKWLLKRCMVCIIREDCNRMRRRNID